MREHPIPQDITGYQFHIIGNMTIKQFAEVAFGVFLAFLVYTTNLPDPIKWPIMALFAGIGALAAFVPIAERPIDHWIVIFISVLYKPTKFYWRREPKVPDAFTFEPSQVGSSVPEVDLTPARRERVKEYLTSLHSTDTPDAFQAYYEDRIGGIVQTFDEVHTLVTDIEKRLEKPELQVKIRNLTSFAQNKPDTVEPAANNQPQFTKQQQSVEAAARGVMIPSVDTVAIANTQVPDDVAEEAGRLNGQSANQAYSDTQAAAAPVQADEAAHFNINLPFPTTPDEPNKPVGMVLGPNNELITNAIVELISETGTVARAVKTNSLGQFFITTPLSDGLYTVAVEKDGYQFNNQELALEGDVIDPIEVRGALVA